MFRDPKLRKLFIVLAVGYAVLVGAFMLTSEKKAPPQTASGKNVAPKEGRSPVSVKMKLSKNVTLEDENQTKDPVVNSPPPNSKKMFYKGGGVSAEWVPSGNKKGSGSFKAYYPNGTLWFEAAFIDGRLEGISRTYYPDGVLWTVSNYKNGAELGISHFFYSNGKPWIEMQIEKGASKGLPVFYSETGESRKAPPISDRQGNKYFKVFDARGDVVTQWAQAGGAEESAITTFYDNAEKSSQWNVLNENLNGDGKIFYSGETVWREYNFEAGRISGVIRSYYSAGSIWTETRMVGEAGRSSMRAFYPGGVVWFVIDPNLPSLDQPVSFFSESYAAIKTAGISTKNDDSSTVVAKTNA